ncbi:sensor histidine kinase [Aquamicrobium zhengzhouense]|uniref:histidine kinase n=1 Tax=Aquamicrobium zhengzhouense TaxID=2781738 RepID=A0ABS0SBU6_9HYPH|nr:HAMP domain-containing sensor histidine kinase [Aquamicrobium zhengzhouense]MBI1620736.1 HAMP domain-containing histidine kinase [Aquamicrobium zhengzhouense]
MLPAVLRTTAARLTAMFMVLFALCAGVLVFYMSTLSVSMLTAQTQETIAEEMQSLARAYQRGSLPALVRFVETRSRQPGANLYLLADVNGRILSGNVDSIEPGVLEADGWTPRPFAYRRYGDRGSAVSPPPVEGAEIQATGHQAVALVLRLPNQMILLVGRDLGEPQIVRDIVNRSLILAFGMMGIGAAVIWFFVGRRALRRIDTVSEASRRIMGGDLTGRLPVNGSGDEFDRLSENLNVMLARIARLNDGLKQVSDNIAHDLKTPLTRLRNRAEVALAGDLEEKDYREALEATISESDQLIRTFNAILMISRLEAGYSSEQTVPVDLARTVADVVELYEPVAEELGVLIEASVQGDATITANRELVAQALSNIVDNAIKYSAGSGEAPRVLVSLRRSDDGVAVEVADNGPGIPEDDHDRATERFVRLERSRSQPGSGLGLSLAKAVMEFHRGRLELSGRNPGLSVKMIFREDSRINEQR